MSLQPKLQRPEWLNRAGDEPIPPSVVVSYKDELEGKDLSGLQIQKTRYYCSLLHKNDGEIAPTMGIRVGRDPIESYPFFMKIGPFRNIPKRTFYRRQWGRRVSYLYAETVVYNQNEPLDGIFANAHLFGASLTKMSGWRASESDLVKGGSTVHRQFFFSRYQTNDNLKHNILPKDIPASIPNRKRFRTHWSFCEPNGVLKPVWQNFNLTNSSLKSADLRYIDLSSANLTGIQSGGVIINSDTKLPRDWIESGGYLLGKTADLRHGDLSGITIQDIDLSQAKLDDIKSRNLVGKPKKLPPNWKHFQIGGINNKGVLIGPKADLQDTDLGDLDLSGLSNEDLKYIKSGNTKGNPILPSEWTKKYGMLFGPKANLKGSDLTDKNLRLLNLNQANLEQTILTGLKSGGIVGHPILPEGYKMGNGHILGPKVNLSNASLTGLDLKAITEGEINLDQAILSETTNTSNLKTGNIAGNPILPRGWKVVNKHLIAPGVNLDGADFRYEDLSGINLYQIDLSQAATLARVKSGQIKVKAPDNNKDFDISHKFSDQDYFLPDHWSLVKGYLVGPKANLSFANLLNADLQNTNLEDADLSNAILDGVKSGGILGGKPKSLPNGWFTNKGGFLIGPGANLDGSQLNRVSFEDKNITGIDLTSSVLSNIRSGNVTLDRGAEAQLPDEWQLSGGWLLGPTANLSYETLSNIALPNGTDLSNANLNGLKSNNISGNPELPSGWALVKQEKTNSGFLLGPGADLEDANFFRINLSDVDLGSLDLSTSNLNGVRSKRTTGSPQLQLPAGWKLDGGYLLGPRADLSDSYLKGVDLSNVDLSGAVLDNSKGYQLEGSPDGLPDGWGVVNKTLLGPTARIFNQKLFKADLGEIDLSDADIDNLYTKNVTRPAKLPSGWNFYSQKSGSGSRGVLIGPGAYLKDITLSGNLSNYDFRNVRSSNITAGKGLFLPRRRGGGYGILNGHIVGPRADLTKADLSNIDFDDADVFSIRNADLSKVKSGGILTDPADINLPVGWNLVHGYLVGPGRIENNFKKGADLTDADFRQDTFEHAEEIVDLSTTDLTGITSNNIKWDNTLRLRPGWRAHCPNSNSAESCDDGGFILGRKVSLPKGADLSELEVNQYLDPFLNNDTFLNDLFGDQFANDDPNDDPEFFIDLEGADLVEVDLSSARIDKAGFNDANMSGAKFQMDSRPQASINDSEFIGTNLQNAFIGTASIADSDFSGADLTGAVISPSNIDAFNTNTFSTETICPDGTASNGLGCSGDQLI